nr:MAG TPA_asm: hypothetical protein [Caudoviricetes sp.]
MCLIIRELFSSSRLCPRYLCRRIVSLIVVVMICFTATLWTLG